MVDSIQVCTCMLLISPGVWKHTWTCRKISTLLPTLIIHASFSYKRVEFESQNNINVGSGVEILPNLLWKCCVSLMCQLNTICTLVSVSQNSWKLLDLKSYILSTQCSTTKIWFSIILKGKICQALHNLGVYWAGLQEELKWIENGLKKFFSVPKTLLKPWETGAWLGFLPSEGENKESNSFLIFSEMLLADYLSANWWIQWSRIKCVGLLPIKKILNNTSMAL